MSKNEDSNNEEEPSAAERPVRTHHMTRSHRMTAVALAVIIGALGALPSAASAASYSVVDAVRMRNNPTAGSAYSAIAAKGTVIDLVCQQWGEAQGPNGNTLWLKVNGAGRNGWWVSDAWTTSPHLAADKSVGISGVPFCGAAPAPTPTPTPAPAGTSITRSFPMYLCTNSANGNCRPSGMPSVSTNQAVSMVCWMKGSTATGDYATDMWFWVTGPAGEGYVSASVVRNQTSVGYCGDRKAFVAAEAAIARVGQTQASAADLALFGSGEWSPGPLGEWAGDCPKLPYVGWKAAGIAVVKNNAVTNYGYWKNLNRIQGGVPPRGAIGFYNVTKWGHEVISLGNGYVATTQGLDGDKLPNAIKKYDAWPSYLGWVLPA